MRFLLALLVALLFTLAAAVVGLLDTAGQAGIDPVTGEPTAGAAPGWTK